MSCWSAKLWIIPPAAKNKSALKTFTTTKYKLFLLNYYLIILLSKYGAKIMLNLNLK